MVFDPRLHLSELNGSNGFTINGLGGNDRLGQSVSRAGDINGDGIEDFVVGASSASPDGKVQAGTSYVIFGGQDFSRGSLDLANLDGNNGFVVEGAENYDVSGSSVSNAGDFNGDGFDDLAIGASGADAIYIVFGGQDFSRSSLNLADLDITDGFVIEGDTQDFNKSIGGFVSSIGDINNDGLDDIVIGSFNPSSDAILEGYIIYGRSDLDSGRLNLVSLSDSDGFKFTGSQKSTSSEFSASGTGDMDGDGIDDLTIGIGTYDSGNYIRSYVAESYVIFGSQDFNAVHLASTDLDGTNGFTIIGLDQPGGGPGGIVNSPGDINGDGVNDILIGDSFGSINIGAGESYIVFGGQDFSSGSLRLAELNGSNGFVIEGVDAYDRSGSAVNGAGDVNGDGIDDVIIGAYAADPNSQRNAGESYVVFGSSNTNRDRLQLADLDGSNGFVIEGSSSGDRSGYAVSNVGDVNGDGIDDVIVGAPDANSSNQPYRYSSAGASYIIFGRASRPPEPTLVIEDNLAVREDTTFVTDAETLDVLDSEGAGLIYSLTGGADQALFNIESSTGELSFNVVPDFENPSDFDGDNIYEVELTVTDTAGLSDRQLLTVDIINVTRGFTPSLNLDELDGSNGFVINGIDENDSSGQIVSQAGDINGDGISDVIISTPYASNAPGDNAIYGESYVVFGRKDRNKSSVNLAELDGSNGFIITRSEDASRFRSVSGAGDINGDGIDEGAYSG